MTVISLAQLLRGLESFEQIEREKICFLRKILGSFPVGGLDGLLRLIEETVNLFNHVLLRRV